MRIEILICIAGLIVFLIVKGITDSIRRKNNIHNSLIDEWGKIRISDITSEKLDSVMSYYQSISDASDVDDITWNDLDGSELYNMLNHSESAMGEEVLFSLLRQPVCDISELEKRDKIIRYFSDHHEDRMKVQSKLKLVGKDKKTSFFEYFSKLETVKKQSNLIHYIILLIWLISVIGIICNIRLGIFLLVFNFVFSVISYYKRKSEIEAYYFTFNVVLKLLYCAGKLSELKIPVIQTELDEIKADRKVFDSFRRNSGIVLSVGGGNILDIIVDYIRMLFHIDLIKFNNMYSFISDHKDTVLKLYKNTGYIDSMISIASFRQYLSGSGWCVPEFTDGKKSLEFTDAYHPFLDEPVVNSFSSNGSSTLLTCSNASGKSTFLKMTAINAIFAQTIVTVTARSYKTSYFRVMTSIALNDNIFENESYFIVEIASLRRIFESIGDTTILCCIDEVLRGTNTIERIAASSQILAGLSEKNVLCFAATHDIELAHILKNRYKNYHFHESIVDDNVIFDYILYPGSSKTKNAIKLLGMMGFGEDITEHAEKAAKYFEEYNIWNIIS